MPKPQTAAEHNLLSAIKFSDKIDVLKVMDRDQL